MQYRYVHILAVLMALSLSACEAANLYAQKLGLKDKPETAMPGSMMDVQAPANRMAEDGTLMPSPGMTGQMVPQQSVPVFPKPQDRDLMVMTDKLSGSSVDIYDLDRQRPVGPRPTVSEPQGFASPSDSSVTIYPLDSVAPQQSAQQTGFLVPPVTYDGSYAGNVMDQGYTMAPDATQIFFDYGSSALSVEDKRVLKQTAEKAKFAPVPRVRVEGHASTRTQTSDPIKGKVLNLKESMNRAYSVSRGLIYSGVPAEKIQTIGWGDTKGPSDGPEAQRVDVITGP